MRGAIPQASYPKDCPCDQKNILFIKNLLLVVQAIIINSVDQLFGSVMLKPEAKAQQRALS